MLPHYRDLDIYKKAEELVLLVYRVTQKFPKEELFGIVSQMRRTAISIVANFVEGYGRRNLKEKIQFFYISLGSLNELEFYVEISFKLGFLNQPEYQRLKTLLTDVKMLFHGYLRSQRNKKPVSGQRTPNSGLRSPNSGQSLIETIVAIFILTTGLASGLALAIFSFGSASDISEKITATGLAREGLEAVRGMRDSNWLSDSLTPCDDLGSGQQCYPDWLNETYSIKGSSGSGQTYRLAFQPQASNNSKWTLENTSSASNYRLYFQPAGELSHTLTSDPSNFFRKLTVIYADTNPPYSGTSPLLLVRSAVWWYGKRCSNELTDLVNPSDTACKIISEEFLTNWRNY